MAFCIEERNHESSTKVILAEHLPWHCESPTLSLPRRSVVLEFLSCRGPIGGHAAQGIAFPMLSTAAAPLLDELGS